MRKNFSRRDLLKIGTGISIGCVMNGSKGFANNYSMAEFESAIVPEWRNRQSAMSYRQLGRTGYMISEIVMGGNTITPSNYKHVEMAIEKGLNYLDTAPAYGNTLSEQGYAHIIRGSSKREKLFLNSKVSIFDNNRNSVYMKIYEELPVSEQRRIDTAVRDLIEQRRILESSYLGGYFKSQIDEIMSSYRSNIMEPKYGKNIDRRNEYYSRIIKSVEESLKRLGTDYLDLVMCPHGVCSPEELEIPEIHEALLKLKKDGKVRSFALSAHNDPAGVLRTAVYSEKYDAAMIAYNVVNGAYLESILWEAYRRNVGVIAMKVARPVYPNRPHPVEVPASRLKKLNHVIPGTMKIPMKAYLWALQNQNISAVISDMVNPVHVNDNLGLAGKKINLKPLEDIPQN